MKQIFVMILLLSPMTGKSQNGAFVEPSSGAGITNMTFKSDSREITGKQSIFSNAVIIALGYENNNIRINTGLGYLKTGFKIKDYSTIYVKLKPVLTDAIFSYDHVIVPFQISYIKSINKRLSIEPGAGIIFCANLGENIAYKNPEKTLKYSINNADFKSIYQSFGYLINGKIDLEYRWSKNLDVFAGPTAYYMAPNFLKRASGSNDKQHNYAILLELGAVFHLRQPAKKNR
jgi:hypothetical protein